MAEEVRVTKVGGARKNIIRFVKEIRSELKKVIWPNRQQLINNTISVLLCCLIIGGIIWIFDFGFSFLVDNYLAGAR